MILLTEKSPWQRAFPGFSYNLLVVVGERAVNLTCINSTLSNPACQGKSEENIWIVVRIGNNNIMKF